MGRYECGASPSGEQGCRQSWKLLWSSAINSITITIANTVADSIDSCNHDSEDSIAIGCDDDCVETMAKTGRSGAIRSAGEDREAASCGLKFAVVV
mmetsp:Transcript_14332/g.39477  ORF Transcript_14332/g.39477 Transcript_14332/m.39477 type:complete len:96 (+) Transcript_14332:223-510(+)